MKKIVFLLFLLGIAHAAYDPMSEEAIAKRIKPVGEVSLEKAAVKAAPVAVIEDVKPVAVGEKVYQQACAVCHAAGVAGAPKKGSADWKDRLKKGKKQLLTNAINGINAMPARGTCLDCSDDDLMKAIEYMLPG